MTKPSIICRSLLSFVVAYRIHCYKKLMKHEQMMTRPELDLVISQFAKIYNNPDMLSALSLCWSVGDNTKTAKDDATQERTKTLLMRLYPTLFDPNLHFDAIYPTRSTPLYQTLNKRRDLALKQSLMNDDQAFMGKLESDINDVR